MDRNKGRENDKHANIRNRLRYNKKESEARYQSSCYVFLILISHDSDSLITKPNIVKSTCFTCPFKKLLDEVTL